ncbi:CD225/dispanin family protein [Halosquirtibacter laminarini]|uniref:CD225/dispanin family protein n=1 Tax=Halosquirtibacter laminarini TaxID=3374600 RepID=A0AC61NKK6_9BACT|nr:CD225/dispanin family protein [Prolixibacteraceae bacterium]
MKKFFILKQGERQGPFTIDELMSQEIKRDTLVFCTDMSDWTRADEVDLLKELISELPPEMPKTSPSKEEKLPPPMPKTWLIESIISTIFLCLPLGIIGIVFSNKVENYYYHKRYDEAAKASQNAKILFLISFIPLVILIAIFACGFFSVFLLALQGEL